MTLEEKATAYAEKIFSEILDKYQTAPWNEFRDALAEIYLAGAREALAGQWRSVEDEYPAVGTICLCRAQMTEDSEPWYFTARFDGLEEWEEGSTKEIYTIPSWMENWDSCTPCCYGDEVTHWMPIPELPEDKSE